MSAYEHHDSDEPEDDGSTWLRFVDGMRERRLPMIDRGEIIGYGYMYVDGRLIRDPYPEESE